MTKAQLKRIKKLEESVKPNKIEGNTEKATPPNAGKGRPKGARNKNTKALKDMILGALERAGGEKYLEEQAKKNASAFLTLIGKVLPTTLNVGGPNDEPLQVTVRVVKVQKP